MYAKRRFKTVRGRADALGGRQHPREALDGYFGAISRYPLMTREEEHAVATEFARTRDPKLGQKLVTANLRFVVKIALGYRSARRKLMDLIQVGNLGLMKAVEMFEPARGLRLNTYAKHWIAAHIRLFVMKDHRLIAIGTTQRERTLFWKLRQVRAALERDGEPATDEQVAEAMDVRPRDVAAMTSRLDPSVETPPLTVEHDRHFERELPAPGESAEEVLERESTVAFVRARADRVRGRLPPRMQKILDERLLTDEPRTLQEIAEELKLTRERVRQLEWRVKDALRKELQEAA